MENGNQIVLREKDAAEYLQVTVSCLQAWRRTGRGNLPYIKLSGCVRYRKSDLDNFINDNVFTNTSAQKHASKNG